MTGIIILAAGSSSRLGKPKQNLIFEGETLLQRTLKTALSTPFRPIVVVLGGNIELIKPTIEDLPVTIVYNEDWPDGMSSSIRAGITDLIKEKGVTSAILTLCDQPFIDTALLEQFATDNKPNAIAACAYNNTIGPPAFFGSDYFPGLLELKGSEGAKHLLLRHLNRVRTIPFPLGSVDIDTVDDFEKLKDSDS